MQLLAMETCFPLLWNLVSLRFQKQFAVLPFHYICGTFDAFVWTINFDRVHSSFLVGQQSSTIIIRTCAGGKLLLKMENLDWGGLSPPPTINQLCLFKTVKHCDCSDMRWEYCWRSIQPFWRWESFQISSQLSNWETWMGRASEQQRVPS